MHAHTHTHTHAHAHHERTQARTHTYTYTHSDPLHARSGCLRRIGGENARQAGAGGWLTGRVHPLRRPQLRPQLRHLGHR
jgi:hypothetical protein